MKRILLDLRPLQSGYAGHGIGRYTRELSLALTRFLEKNPRPDFALESLVFAKRPLPDDFALSAQLPVGLSCPEVSKTWLWDQTVLGMHLQRRRWDLLHNFTALGPLADISLPYWGAQRSVATIHDLHLFRKDAEPVLQSYRRTKRIRIQELALRRARAIVTDSTHVADELRLVFPFLTRTTPIHTIAPGIDHIGIFPQMPSGPDPSPIASDEGRAEPLKTPATPYVLTVGETGHKGLAFALRCLRIARSRGLHAKLVMVGKKESLLEQLRAGPDAENGRFNPIDIADAESERHASNQGRNWEPALEGVELVGRVTDEELRNLYAGALALLYPSTREGFGFPTLEAQSLGCPVLALAQEPMQSLIACEAHRLPSGEAEAWVQALQDLAGDSSWRDQCSQQARQFASGFTWDRTARQIVQLWESLLA